MGRDVPSIGGGQQAGQRQHRPRRRGERERRSSSWMLWGVDAWMVRASGLVQCTEARNDCLYSGDVLQGKGEEAPGGFKYSMHVAMGRLSPGNKALAHAGPQTRRHMRLLWSQKLFSVWRIASQRATSPWSSTAAGRREWDGQGPGSNCHRGHRGVRAQYCFGCRDWRRRTALALRACRRRQLEHRRASVPRRHTGA
jgi:hypothetical protein